MKLFKAHGLGNDYFVLEEGPPMTAEAVVALCDRHHGLGSDGLLEPVPSDRAPIGVRIWNPDGSIAERSGNGLRIFAYWAARELGNTFTVEVGGDLCPCTVDGLMVDVRLATATIAPAEVLDAAGTALTVLPVTVGNPHCVVFVDSEPLDAVNWRVFGAALERHPRFPQRTNVQFAKVSGAAQVDARIWERGAGETLASGSSACAVAFAAVRTGRLGGTSVAVTMPGGVLQVTVHADDAVDLRGPVTPVARLQVDWLG